MSIYNSQSDLNKYRYFYAVAECLSFSEATELLHVSQPAISHAIKELEEQLDVKLFVREGKRISLTSEGEKLMNYVQNAFENIVAGERCLKDKGDDLGGKIRIGMYPHLARIFLPKILRKYSKKYPNVRFNIFSLSDREMREKLHNKELDVLILHYPIFTNDMTYTEEKICDLESGYFGTKEYYDIITNGKSNSFREIPLILPLKGFIDTNVLEQSLKKRSIYLQPKYRVYSTEMKKELAMQGMGVCWVSKCCVEKELESKELYEIPLDLDKPSMTLSMAYDNRFMRKALEEFIKMFKEEYQEKQDK